MQILKENIFYKTIKQLENVLFDHHKKKALVIFLMTLFSGVLEVFGLAVILPVISVALDKTIIHSNYYLKCWLNLLYKSHFFYWIYNAHNYR